MKRRTRALTRPEAASVHALDEVDEVVSFARSDESSML
jgi:hypothetical protein